ncbi:MAG: hypothetical protein NC821_06350, partial [Candidatus Omnitrophica bacterium]|nr:hypothetical protein [Candidatus Omnitrophota bacterium]
MFRIFLFIIFLSLFLKNSRKYLNYLIGDFRYWLYLFSLALSFIFAQNQAIGLTRLYKLVFDSLLIYFPLAY